MSVKLSKVSDLLDSLVDVMQSELDAAKGSEGIPLGAADKAVVLALIKHCGVTAEPDSDAMKTLEESFSSELEKRRKARATQLTSQIGDDGISSLMQ